MSSIRPTVFRSFVAACSVTIPALVYAQSASLAPLRPALPRMHTPQPTTGAITPADLMTRLYIFADDSMQGRQVGTIGNVKGTDYIEHEVRKMGLQPAGDNGTYFQTIPLVVWRPAAGASVTIDGKAIPASSFFPLQGELTTPAVPIVYAGHAGDSLTLTAAQTDGKLVVFSAPTAERMRSNPNGVFGYRLPSRISPNALGVLYVALDQVLPAQRKLIDDPPASMQVPGQRPRLGRPMVFLNTAVGDMLFGVPIAQVSVGTVGKNVAVDYKFAEQPAPHPGRNVVAIIPGSDPVLKHEYVAIGAHNDHIGMGGRSVDHDSLRVFNHFALIGGADSPRRPATSEEMTTINATLAELRKMPWAKTPRQDSIYNGADDDGSGSVSVLEIAQYFASMKVKPKRSLLFVWHTGEEAGLWGSTWFTDHPTVPRDSIVTQLNMDMVGRGDATDITGGNPNYLQLVGSRRLSTELGDLVDSVNVKDKHGLAFDYTFDATGHPAQIYCRSDHYSYARYGIPVTFFTTGGHPDYHQLTDEPEYIDYDHMARVDSFIADVALHVANLDHRPVVDKPKPDPNGACVQ